MPETLLHAITTETPMNPLFNAFISYGRKESKAFAIDLETRLRGQGLRIWFDQQDIPPSVDYQKQIDDGIERSENFIFIITPHAVQSPYCRLEIELALKCGKRIIPLFQLEPTDGWGNMHPVIEKLNWIYFDGSQPYEAAFEQLMQSLALHKDYVGLHTEWLNAALWWERHQYQTRYLLVGQAREQAARWLALKFTDGQVQAPCQVTDVQAEFIGESIKNANNLMTDAILCYPPQEQHTAQNLRRVLMREPLTVWNTAHESLHWDTATAQGIAGANTVIVLHTPQTLADHTCQSLLQHAQSLNKRLLTLWLHGEVPPSGEVIDCRAPTQDEHAVCLAHLLRTLHEEPLYFRQHKVLLVKALRWQAQDHNASVLLHGRALEEAQAWLKTAVQYPKNPPTEVQKAYLEASQAQPKNLTQDVFISYSRKDSDIARQLNQALQMQGKTTWFDQENIDPASDFRQEIHRGIDSSDNFLFILSPDAVSSEYCGDEVDYAQQQGKRMISVLHRAVLPTSLPPALQTVQWLDFNAYDGDFYRNFSRLIQTLETDREHVRAHTQWSQRAREWEARGRSEDVLLRGNEYAMAAEWLKAAADKNPPPTALQRAYLQAGQQAIQAQEYQKNRNTLMLRGLLAVSVLGLVLAIGLFFIAEDAREAAVANETAALQAKEAAETSMHKAQQAQSRFLAEKAEVLRKEGRVREAISLSLEALPQHVDDPKQRPFVSETGQVLLKSVQHLREYAHLPQAVNHAQFSPDGSQIFTATEQQVQVWEAKSRTLLRRIDVGEASQHLTFSPKAHYFLRIQAERVEVWDLTTGKRLQALSEFTPAEVATIQTQTGWAPEPTFDVEHAVFSPNEQWIVAYDENTAAVWSVADGQRYLHTGEPLSAVPFKKRADPNNPYDQVDVINALNQQMPQVDQVFFSHDSQYLIVTAHEHGRIWNTQDFTQAPTVIAQDIGISLAQLSPNGTDLATIDAFEHSVRLWNIRSGTLRLSLKPFDSVASSIAFNAPGDVLAVAGGGERYQVHVWDTHDGHISHSLEIEWPVVKLAWQGKSIYFQAGGRVWLWQPPQDAQEIAAFNPQLLPRAHESVSYTLGGAFELSPQGRFLLIQQPQPSLWEPVHTQKLATFAGAGTLKFSPDGQSLLNRQGRLWSVQPAKGAQSLEGHTQRVTRLRFSPDGQQLASIANYWDDWRERDQQLLVWDVAQRQLKHRLVTNSRHELGDMQFSPDGQTLAASDRHATDESRSTQGRINLWNVQTGRLQQQWFAHEATITALDFSRDGQQLATGSEDITVGLWNVAQGQLLHHLRGREEDGWHENSTVRHQRAEVKIIAINPDGTRLAAAGEAQAGRLWNTQNGQEIAQLPHGSGLYDVVFSHDGRYLLSTAYNGSVKLWDGHTGQAVRELKGHEKAVVQAVFSPDDRYILTASHDHSARLWSVADGQEPLKLMHSAKVSRVAFHPQGSLLASGTQSGGLFLWNAQTGQLFNDLSQSKPVYDMQFSPTGEQLAVTNGQRVTLWAVFKDIQAVIDYAHTLDLEPLSKQQRQQFFLE